MFNIGDVVVLKSGGPAMTVISIEAGHFGNLTYGKLTCMYYYEGIMVDVCIPAEAAVLYTPVPSLTPILLKEYNYPTL